MKKLLLITLFFGATNLFAQQQQDSLLVKEIPIIKNNLSQQQIKIDNLTNELQSQQRIINQQKNKIDAIQVLSITQKQLIDSLSQLIQTNSQNIVTNSKELGTKIQETGQMAETKISELGGDVEKNRLYWIIATLITLLLGALMYLFLGKRIKSSKSDVETQIRNTKKTLEEEGLKLDSELVKIFQKQLEVLENTPKSTTQDEDHSLVLKIADRLTAMETNHYRMDPNTKGLKQLKNAVKSIKENYLAKGYEIVEMLELEYKEGMNVTANFIPSDKIEKGKRIITRVIKPQVNFNGKMIQAAQIEVSVGE
jgi:hypothetical protein